MNKHTMLSMSVVILLVVAFLTSSCGHRTTNQFEYNQVKEFKTDIEPKAVTAETVLSPDWGSGDGQVAHNPTLPDLPENAGPSRFCVDSAGRIYIDDYYNRRVVRFEADGQHSHSYPYPSDYNEGTVRPEGMAATGDGLFYWVTYGGHISCYDINGILVSEGDINKPPAGWPSNKTYEWEHRFIDIESIRIGCDGYLYFSYNTTQLEDDNEGGVIKCSEKGEPLGSIAFSDIPKGSYITNFIIDSVGNFYITQREEDGISSVWVINQQGEAQSKIDIREKDIAFLLLGMDSIGNLYVESFYDDPAAGTSIPEFFKFDSKGNLLARYRIEDYESGFGRNIAFRDDGSIYSMYCPISEEEGNLTVYRIQL